MYQTKRQGDTFLFCDEMEEPGTADPDKHSSEATPPVRVVQGFSNPGKALAKQRIVLLTRTVML
jgi:hypothetical protein